MLVFFFYRIITSNPYSRLSRVIPAYLSNKHRILYKNPSKYLLISNDQHIRSR